MYKDQLNSHLAGTQSLNFDQLKQILQKIFNKTHCEIMQIKYNIYIFLLDINIFCELLFSLKTQIIRVNIKRMKPSQQRSGTVRCQRCYKFGHYTYECQNEVAYRYRPSRTVMYKQQIKMALNKDKGPQTIIRNPDKQRRIEDKASSEDEEQIKKQQQIIRKENQNRKADIKLQEKQKIGSNKKQDQQEDQQSSSSSSQSSSCSSSSSQSSISEDQDSDQVQDSVPQKKRKQ